MRSSGGAECEAVFLFSHQLVSLIHICRPSFHDFSHNQRWSISASLRVLGGQWVHGQLESGQGLKEVSQLI